VSSRREFLGQLAATGSALVLPTADCGATGTPSSSSKALRLLILGGTGNIGPYHVRAAVERGHHVSVFSRGRSAAELPAGVERLIGDRSGDLSSIRGRDWDAVLDIATFGPGWVRTLGEALKGHVGHYTFISTVSVYDDPAANKITDETSRVLAYHGSADPYSVTTEGADYGALKVLCERESERQFPSRTLTVRPGYICGPGDTHAPLLYWLLRMQHGGEVLAAGDPSTPVQFIDVRDLAEWIVRMIEKREAGIYNAVGPVPPIDLAGVLNVAASTTAPTPPKLTWVPRSWLSTWKDREIVSGLLFWELNRGSLSGISNARALAQGLTARSVDVTLADTWRWLEKQPPQAEIRIGYRPKPDHSGFEPIELPWPAYLDRETELLTAWHASEQRKG
jgi:2'-hydroxyisoflavone reductase